MKYLLVDTANLFARARHSSARGADMWQRIGLALHVTFTSILKAHRQHKPDHIIFALESRSWRKDHTASYKANRKVTKDKMTVREAEEDKEFWQCYEELTNWLNDRTNASVIKVEQAEADDIIARWIALHPSDSHVILSNDSDFHQLLAENVTMYNGLANHLITLEGVFDDNGKPVIDKLTKKHKTVGDPKWILFEKCMRGDPTDNVMSACPGVRVKGTAKRVGLTEAFADRDRKGWAWNNLMLQRWVDHDGIEHRVLDRYDANRVLIDLTAQPIDIRDKIDTALIAVNPRENRQIGTQLIKFCAKFELNKISESVQSLADALSKPLVKETTDA
jgi:5'-3' exonuclease